MKRRLSGWGRYPVVEADERRSHDLAAITDGAVLTRGLGRSYGDASLPCPGDGPVACSRDATRVVAVDERTGTVEAEAGTPLDALHRALWPRGWTLPVVPGTARVTLGGMIAADVHGKNHHVDGTLGAHVDGLRMRTADGEVRDTAPGDDLFDATLGGMGLTGHILSARVRLQRIRGPRIRRDIRITPDLDATLAALEEASRRRPLTVAWVDALARGRALGRGAVQAGDWAEAHDGATPAGRSVSLPFSWPNGALARWNVAAFNRLYLAAQRRSAGERTVPAASFLHPLDGLGRWNLAYGRRGFTQYQCVLPQPDARKSVLTLFETLRRVGAPSFLTVVKDCGAAGRGLLSFPRPGISVALDLPIVGARVREWIDALDRVVVDAGGRVYLAKDAFTTRAAFADMDGQRLRRFDDARRRHDPERRIRSALSRRLLEAP